MLSFFIESGKWVFPQYKTAGFSGGYLNLFLKSFKLGANPYAYRDERMDLYVAVVHFLSFLVRVPLKQI